MLKVFFLTIFPPAILLGFGLYAYVLLYWQHYIIQRNMYKYLYETKVISKKLEFTLFVFFRFLLIILILLIIFLCYIMTLHNLDLRLFFINNLIIYQLFIFLLIMLLITYTFVIAPHFLVGKSIDMALFFLTTIFISITLFISNNILILFINLEIINVLVIYSFFISSYLNISSKKNVNFTVNWIVTSTIYQFILNFFSSIMFYIIFNMLLIHFGTTNLIFLNFFTNTNNYLYDFYIAMLYLSIFIKFGIGPWIFFKIEIYQGYNLFLLILYTVIYFTIILVFFFNLFVIYGANLSFLFILLLFIFAIIAIIYFLFNIFFYFNLFMFFSFSSLLNLLLFMCQWSILLIFSQN